MSTLLQVKHLTKKFAALTAVSDVSFSMQEGEIFGIIGPNGAGKSTLFNVIAGLYRPSIGEVTFRGEDITGLSSDQVARKGIARTFQSVHVFKRETVRENLRRADVISRLNSPTLIFSPRSRPSADIDDVAQFLGMEGLLDLVAGDLAYGHQKILGLGLAMMVDPKLLLMDEPVAGLNSSEKKQVGRLIRRLRDERGVSVLIVEHDMPLMMGACDRILVVNQGQHVALGSASEIKSDQKVIDAYLGETYEFA